MGRSRPDESLRLDRAKLLIVYFGAVTAPSSLFFSLYLSQRKNLHAEQ